MWTRIMVLKGLGNILHYQYNNYVLFDFFLFELDIN
ncbi:hypothetical protein E2C01_064199 [Portunus trituberculatus]|uniref:Uncharacterized protein n=1 Tax=Portunus trituberculatus TaxID=210409 RepID=A0A5B7HJ43_PORTR|nr:hypothetical protein [Portunus trituberculatus]